MSVPMLFYSNLQGPDSAISDVDGVEELKTSLSFPYVSQLVVIICN